VLSDGARDIVRLDEPYLVQRILHRDKDVDVKDVHDPVAVGPWHVGVHLGDEERGIFRGALDDVNGDTKTHLSVFVRRGHLDEGDIQGDLAGGKEPGNIIEADGRIPPESLLDVGPDVFSDEKTVDVETVGQVLAGVRGLSHGQEVDDLHVRELAGPVSQGVDEAKGCGASGPDEDPLTRRDPSDGILRSGDHVLVAPLPARIRCVRLLVRHGRSSGPASLIRASATTGSVPTRPTIRGLISISRILGNSFES